MSDRLRQLTTWPHLPAVVFFVIFSVVMLYPAALHLNDAILDRADPLLNSWILAWDARTLISRPLELYHANIFYPYSNTLAYSETLLGMTPVSNPIIWLTGNPLLAYNILWFLSFVLSGLGTYGLTYRFTGSRWAGLIAGTIFAFNPFRFAHIAHIQLTTAQWIPLVCLFLDRLVERRSWRDLALLTLTFNLQVLSSYYYALFIAIGVAVLLIAYWLTLRPAFNSRLYLQVLVFGLITVALNLPLMLPYFAVAHSMGFERSFEDAIRGGADLADFLTVGPQNWLYGSLVAPLRGKDWWEHTLFPGLVAVGLALAGLARFAREPRRAENRFVLRFGLLLIVAIILALGPELRWRGQTLVAPLPYAWLYHYVPVFSAIRQPARMQTIIMLCLSVLAGYGAVGLARLQTQRLGQHLGNALSAIVIGLITAEYVSLPASFLTLPTGDQLPAVYRWLAEQPTEGPILEWPVRSDIGQIEGPRLYYSTFHWKRLVNGYSGWHTPLYDKLLRYSPSFPDEPSLRWIVGVGVQYLIVHRGQLTPDELAWLDAHIGNYACCLSPVRSFGDDQVYQVLQPLTGAPTGRGWQLGRSINLLGYWMVPTPAQPGDELTLRLFWQRRAEPASDSIVFAQILDSSGALVAQHQGVPAESTRPTSSWRMDEVIMDRHTLQLPPQLAPGQYQVSAAMYLSPTLEPVPISTWQGNAVRDSLSLGWLTVQSKDQGK